MINAAICDRMIMPIKVHAHVIELDVMINVRLTNNGNVSVVEGCLPAGRADLRRTP